MKVLWVTTFIGLFFYFFWNIHKIPLNPDEVSWFYHTEFFKLMFIDRDLKNQKWQSYESYDHPQLSKYIYGAALYAYDRDVFIKRDILEKKWGRWNFYFNESFSYQEFSRYIYVMRYVQVFFAWGTVSVISLIFFQFTKNYLLSLLLPIALVSNSLFLNTMLRATSDAHMVFFTYLAFFLYIQKKEHVRLLAVVVALAISAKLTGLLSILLVPRKIILFLIIIGAIWCIQNPALYASPVQNSWKYINFRLEQSLRLQHAFSDIALVSNLDRFLSIFRVVFANNLLLLFAFCFGIYCGPKKLWIFSIILFSFIGFYLPLDTDRYYTPLIPAVYIGYFIAINALLKWKNPPPTGGGFFQKISLWAGKRKKVTQLLFCTCRFRKRDISLS